MSLSQKAHKFVLLITCLSVASGSGPKWETKRKWVDVIRQGNEKSTRIACSLIWTLLKRLRITVGDKKRKKADVEGAISIHEGVSTLYVYGTKPDNLPENIREQILPR
ncbi:hypothetical protein L3X38_033969 [Prunus dulcis]|uniref:Uncharacterized protein n=1 Tax=Prunus dulcis TaxID=3755 RepID=A0AAD4VI06_PRUDU|nr:hypothetical protein L3X38_033969 [Prunus dulcis]